MYVLACETEITAGLECSSGWSAEVYIQPFNIESLSPEVAIQYFGAGFALPVVPLAAAFAVAFILKTIRG